MLPRMRAVLLLGLAVVLLTAACGSDSDDGGGEVRPFSDVQGSDLVFENDPTFPGRGIFRVTTTEPMICAIVWGPTEELGSFNNSLAMSGTGIVQHDVFLPGAMAGETYFYRVQGSSADGTLFQSELAQFTLPAAVAPAGDDAADRGENLALRATVLEVSSEFGASWVGANAVDGDLATEWSTRGDGDDGYIVIDLGSAREIAGVEFLTRTMTDGTATTSTFWLTADDGPRLGPFAAGNPADTAYAEVAVTGQTLRFEIESSTGGNTGAIEIRVFAP